MSALARRAVSPVSHRNKARRQRRQSLDRFPESRFPRRIPRRKELEGNPDRNTHRKTGSTHDSPRNPMNPQHSVTANPSPVPVPLDSSRRFDAASPSRALLLAAPPTTAPPRRQPQPKPPPPFPRRGPSTSRAPPRPPA